LQKQKGLCSSFGKGYTMALFFGFETCTCNPKSQFTHLIQKCWTKVRILDAKIAVHP
jgi:hypothetical protein